MPDRILQARLLSFGYMQRYRLRTVGSFGGNANYEPNRFGDFAQDRNAFEPRIAAGAIDRYDHRQDDDYYSQPGALLFDAGGNTSVSLRTSRGIQVCRDDMA